MCLQIISGVNNNTAAFQLSGLLASMNESRPIHETEIFSPVTKSPAYVFGERVLKPLIDATYNLSSRSVSILKYGFSPIDTLFSRIFNFGVEAANVQKSKTKIKKTEEKKFGLKPNEKTKLTQFMKILATFDTGKLEEMKPSLDEMGTALSKLHPFDTLATIHEDETLKSYLNSIKERDYGYVWDGVKGGLASLFVDESPGFKEFLSGQINNNHKDLSKKVDQFLLQIGMSGKDAKHVKGFIKKLEEGLWKLKKELKGKKVEEVQAEVDNYFKKENWDKLWGYFFDHWKQIKEKKIKEKDEL